MKFNRKSKLTLSKDEYPFTVTICIDGASNIILACNKKAKDNLINRYCESLKTKMPISIIINNIKHNINPYKLIDIIIEER